MQRLRRVVGDRAAVFPAANSVPGSAHGVQPGAQRGLGGDAIRFCRTCRSNRPLLSAHGRSRAPGGQTRLSPAPQKVAQQPRRRCIARSVGRPTRRRAVTHRVCRTGPDAFGDREEAKRETVAVERLTADARSGGAVPAVRPRAQTALAHLTARLGAGAYRASGGAGAFRADDDAGAALLSRLRVAGSAGALGFQRRAGGAGAAAVAVPGAAARGQGQLLAVVASDGLLAYPTRLFARLRCFAPALYHGGVQSHLAVRHCLFHGGQHVRFCEQARHAAGAAGGPYRCLHGLHLREPVTEGCWARHTVDHRVADAIVAQPPGAHRAGGAAAGDVPRRHHHQRPVSVALPHRCVRVRPAGAAGGASVSERVLFAGVRDHPRLAFPARTAEPAPQPPASDLFPAVRAQCRGARRSGTVRRECTPPHVIGAGARVRRAPER
eukprot:ctg_1014.g321